MSESANQNKNLAFSKKPAPLIFSGNTAPIPFSQEQRGFDYALWDKMGLPKPASTQKEAPVDTETQRYVDAKTDAVRAQNDARFAEIRSDIAALGSKLDAAPTKWTVVGVGATVLGGVLAFLAFGGDRFDGGMGAASLSVDQAIQARDTSQRNAERLDSVDQKLDLLLGILGEKPEQ